MMPFRLLSSIAFLGLLCSSPFLQAQLLNDAQLAFARQATTLVFGEHELNKLGPSWEIAPLEISFKQEVAARETMERYAEEVVSLHSSLYNLTESQNRKLLAAAMVDVRQFSRRFIQAEVAEPAMLRARRNMRLPPGVQFVQTYRIQEDLLGANSLFMKTHASLLTADQRDYAIQHISKVRQQWISTCTWADLVRWMSRGRIHISVGQWSRLKPLLKPEQSTSELSALEFVRRFSALNPTDVEAILSPEQLSEIRTTLQIQP